MTVHNSTSQLRLVDQLSHVIDKDRLFWGDKLSRFDRGVDPRSLEAEVVVAPRTIEEVVSVVHWCGENNISMVAHGGRTTDNGSAATRRDQVIVHMREMRRIIDIDPFDGSCLVEAGVTLEELQNEAAKHGWTTGVDIGGRSACTIGGMISTNAGGNETFRFGMMRQSVLGLEAVLADGTIISDLTRVVKTNMGYDVKQLFIGSEGTLGIVTRAVLQLVPLRRGRATALVAMPDWTAAVRAFARWRRETVSALSKIELMSWNQLAVPAADLKTQQVTALASEVFHLLHGDVPNNDDLSQNHLKPVFLLVEFEADNDQQAHESIEHALAAAIEDDSVPNAVIAKNGQEVSELWHVREEWVIERLYSNQSGYDVAIPLAHLPNYIDRFTTQVEELRADIRIFFLGHLGDGNLHITLNADRPYQELQPKLDAIAYKGIDKIGAAFSAEHGIGLDKKAAVEQWGSKSKLFMMQQLKAALDPNNIFNPGKIFD